MQAKERNFDLYSQFQLDDKLILSDENSTTQSTPTQHTTSNGIVTTSYYSPWYENGDYHPLHYCLRDTNLPLISIMKQEDLNSGTGLNIRYINAQGYGTENFDGIFNSAPTIETQQNQWKYIYTEWEADESPSEFHGQIDYWAMHFSGYFQSNDAGSYSFSLKADDTARFYIDDVYVGTNHYDDFLTSSITLKQNTIYKFDLKFVEYSDVGRLLLTWQGPSISDSNAPRGRFYYQDPRTPYVQDFIADGASISNPFITTKLTNSEFIKKVHVYPYVGRGYATNGIVQCSIDGTTWINCGNYTGIGKTSIEQFDEVKVDRYVNYIRLMPTVLSGSRMELKQFKIFKEVTLQLDSGNSTVQELNLDENLENFTENINLKINGHVELIPSDATISTITIANDYTEGTPAGLNLFDLKGQLWNVESTEVRSEEILSSVLQTGQLVSEFDLDSVYITNESDLINKAKYDFDKEAGNALIKIDGRIKIETAKDYYFWPYTTDTFQLKIDDEIISYRYGETIQSDISAQTYATSYTNLNWKDNLNTIHAMNSGEADGTHIMFSAIPSPFVEGEWFTYWTRYYNPTTDGYAQRYYQIIFKKTKDFKEFYQVVGTSMYTAYIRTMATWYNNNQQNPYHVYNPRVFWVKEYQKFICFLSVYNNTTTTPGDSGWNLATMESPDGIAWINARLIVANDGTSIDVGNNGTLCLGNTGSKWFILFERRNRATNPQQGSIARSECVDLFSAYSGWSAPTIVISYNDSGNIPTHTNSCTPGGLIKDSSGTAKYKFIYSFSTGTTEADRIYKQVALAYTDDGITFTGKIEITDPDDFIHMDINIPKALGGANKISYRGDHFENGQANFIQIRDIDYGKYSGKFYGVFNIKSAYDQAYTDGYIVGHGSIFLDHDQWNDLSTGIMEYGLHCPFIYNKDANVYPSQIIKDGDQYNLYMNCVNDNSYGALYKYQSYVCKTDNLVDLYDHNLLLAGYLNRPLTGIADPENTTYGNDNYSNLYSQIVKQSNNQYHLFYLGRKTAQGELKLFHSFSTDGKDWGWSSEIVNSTSHASLSGSGLAMRVSMIYDSENSKFVGVGTAYSTAYTNLLMQCSSDPHVKTNWTFSTITNNGYTHSYFPNISKNNGIYHLTFNTQEMGPGINGLYEKWWNNTSWTGATTCETYITSTINFTQSNGGVSIGCSGLVTGNYSILFEGMLKTTATGGTYNFLVSADNYMRVYIGDTNVVQWTSGAGQAQGAISLSANTYYRLRVWYRNEGGPGTCRLWWIPPGGGSWAIIPASYYYRLTTSWRTVYHAYSTNLSAWYFKTLHRSDGMIYYVNGFGTGHESDFLTYPMFSYDEETKSDFRAIFGLYTLSSPEWNFKITNKVPDFNTLCRKYLTVGVHKFELIQKQSKNSQSLYTKEFFLDCKWSGTGENPTTLVKKVGQTILTHHAIDDFSETSWKTAARSWYTEATSANRSAIKPFPSDFIIYTNDASLVIYNSINQQMWMRFLYNSGSSNAWMRSPIEKVAYGDGRLYDVQNYSNTCELREVNFKTDTLKYIRVFYQYTEYIYNSTISARNSSSGYTSVTGNNIYYYGWITRSSVSDNFINNITCFNTILYKNVGYKTLATLLSGIDQGTYGTRAMLNGDPCNDSYTYHTSGGSIVIDFGTQIRFDKMNIHFYYGDGRTYGGYRISGSYDNITYTTFLDRTSENGFQYVVRETFIKQLWYRYIKIQGTGNTLNTATHITQLDIYDSEKISMNILCVDHKEGMTYLNNENRNFRHVIALDYLGNVMECKKSKIVEETLYVWFRDSNKRMDVLYIKDNFGETVDLLYSYNTTLQKYVYNISQTNDFVLRKEGMTDFDVYEESGERYIILSDKENGSFKYKENREAPSIVNLELIQ